MKQTGFIGFPDKKMQAIVVPDLFFTDLLPLIDDLAELKLTLHCFWLLNGQEGDLRYLRGDDLRGDATLLASLNLESDLRSPLATLEDALERAVARNSLLKMEIETDVETDLPATAGDSETERQAAEIAGTTNADVMVEDWYFMNTVKGRQTVALIRQGKLSTLVAAIPNEARLRVERPNIFIMYEQNIGLMTPMIAEQLRDVEKTYPPDWVDEAFQIAVSRNKRALRYIQAILRRWESEGKDETAHEESGRDADERRRRDYRPNQYSDIIQG